METIKKIFSWLRAISPTWLRALVIALLGALVFIYSVTACGTLHTTVRMRNPKDNPVVNLSITTHNPTSVDIAPNVSADSTIVTIR